MQRSPELERPAGPSVPHSPPARGAAASAGRPTTIALALSAAATGGLAWGLGRRATHLLGSGSVEEVRAAWTAPGVRVEDLVELLAVCVGTGVAAWFALGLTVAAGCAAARSAGRAWVAGERLLSRAAPAVVRRAVVASAGTGLALAGALPAVALAPPPPEDLGWVVTTDGAPDRDAAAPPPGTGPGGAPRSPARSTAGPGDAATGPEAGATATHTPAPGPAAAATPPPAGLPDRVVVEPGDTLWGIAYEHLPAGATHADVAAAWPTWYAANVAVVGSDPDLIRPGQRLLAPTAAATGTTDGADR